MAKKPKSFNAEIDSLLEGLELPSDADLRHETHKEKIKQSKLAFYATPAGQQHKELIKKTTNSPENLAKKAERMRNDRGIPCMFISINGQEFKFRSAGEASEYFGKNVSIHIPLKGAKRIQRNELRNWIVVRLDGSATKEEINKLKEEVQLKINPPKKARDIEAWKKKMNQWRKSPAGKNDKKKRQESARSMGKKNSRAIMTPDGQFESQAAAAKFYGINTASMSQRLRDHPSKYWKV